ncbi:hypothetical protein KC887_05265 [Candidatus Kaiserbacteria bacterium]|nr:hypothetical protein [Candidatus Kaiserbacteria bacterium]
MTERIVGDYTIVTVEETVDGLPSCTQVARLNPANATHFEVKGIFMRNTDTPVTRQGDDMFIFNQKVGHILKYDSKADVLLCEVIPVG